MRIFDWLVKKKNSESNKVNDAGKLLKEAVSEVSAQQTAESEERKKKLDEIKRRTIDITKLNLHEYSSLDIVAFSFAVPGAQGESGGIYVIAEDGNVYHTNLRWNDISIDDVFLICPPLRDCRFGLFGADHIPGGWDYHYMGAGNHLFVRNDISKCVDEMSVGLEKFELYQQWKYMVMHTIKENGKNKTKQETLY